MRCDLLVERHWWRVRDMGLVALDLVPGGGGGGGGEGAVLVLTAAVDGTCSLFEVHLTTSHDDGHHTLTHILVCRYQPG